MTGQSAATAQDELLSEWYKKAWLKRLFLPGDFLEQVSMDGAENNEALKVDIKIVKHPMI